MALSESRAALSKAREDSILGEALGQVLGLLASAKAGQIAADVAIERSFEILSPVLRAHRPQYAGRDEEP